MQKEEINKLFTPKDYAIVCREYSKISVGKAVYEVPVKEFDNQLFTGLKLRSRFNPELTYFVTKRENLDLVINTLSADEDKVIIPEGSLMVKI